MSRVYLDYNATAPALPEVIEAVTAWMGRPANAASAHAHGREAAAALDDAREAVAALVGGRPDGVVFTSGATEANHLGIRGLAALARPGAVWVSAVDHPCAVAAAELCGREVRRIPVDGAGRVRVDAVADAAVLACTVVQHETGVIQPVWELLAFAGATDTRLHLDATQAAAHLALPLGGADAIALSSHKLGGPAGVGALVLARGGPFPSLFPGTQERARRGGTVNVAGAVGFGVAARCALASRASRAASARDRRERLEAGLVARGARVVGVAAERAPGTTLVVFPGVRGDALVGGLDAHGISVSAGAACASGSAQPSAALVAVGDPEPHGALRVSHGHASTVADIEALFAALDVVLPGLRSEASWLDWLDG